MIKDFNDRFSQDNAPWLFQIQKAIASQAQGLTTVSNYHTSLKGLRHELASYNALPSCFCGRMEINNKQKDQDHTIHTSRPRALQSLPCYQEKYSS
jgi:hypothetical protein